MHRAVAPEKVSADTHVSRTLVGAPGMTYRYLGLRIFAHPWSASYLINPVLLDEYRQLYFRHVLNQKTLSTGMTAVAFASRLCDTVHLFGFGNGSCPHQAWP